MRSWIRDHRSWILPAALVLLLILVNAFTASGARLPLYWEDEAGYMGNAQVMSGVGHIPVLRGRPYYIGWSLLLVPFWWIFQSGLPVYIAGLALSALFGIATAIPLALIARRMGLSWQWSIAAGAVICLSPAHTLLSHFALPENLLTFLVAYAALFAIRFHQEKSLANALGLGLFVGAAFVTHGRVIPIVAATALWFLWTLRRHFRASIIALVSMGVVSVGGFLLYRYVTDLLYVSGGARESVGVSRILHANLFYTLMSGLGQIWYLVFATVGLAILGFVVLGRRLAAEWRVRKPGLAVWAFIGILGMAAISFTSISEAIERGSSRLDILSYGRYLDPIMVVLSLAGLVLVIRGLSRKLALGTLITAAVIGLLWFVIVFPNRTVIGTQWWAPINVTGTLQYGWHWHARIPSAPWSIATVVVLVALVVMFFLRKRAAVIISILAIFLTVSTVYAQTRVIDPFFTAWETGFTLRTTIADDPLLKGKTVAFDINGIKDFGDIASKNAYQLLLAPAYVPLVDSSVAAPTQSLVISRQDWPEGEALGARKVANDKGLFSNALWVMPGALQDKLAAAGDLIPNDSTTLVPAN